MKKTVFEHLRHRLESRAGLAVDIWTAWNGRLFIPRYALPLLARQNWLPEFERLMRNRLIMGSIRYGLNFRPGKPQYDRMTDITHRATHYLMTGNLEDLVDIANLAMLEFGEGCHPKAHFDSADDTGIHTQITDNKA